LKFFSNHSTAPKSFYGLFLLGLAAVLFELIVIGYDRYLPYSEQNKTRSGRCIYQVFQDEFCIGTAFFEQPQSAPTILKALGMAAGKSRACEEKNVPCDRAINLKGQHPWITIDKISGTYLLTAGKRIDLNLADQADLMAVPGIGPRLADRIVAYRNSKGSFSSIQELDRIKGIGQKKQTNLGPYLYVSHSD
jgi:competence ComEA-like helix-hairpin-helix protein